MWSDVPQNIPTEFFKSKFNDRSWDNIEVPSNWEMLGCGDKMFRNVSAPFHVNVPFVPSDYNPTGVYRREFQLPNNWNGHRCFYDSKRLLPLRLYGLMGTKWGIMKVLKNLQNKTLHVF